MNTVLGRLYPEITQIIAEKSPADIRTYWESFVKEQEKFHTEIVGGTRSVILSKGLPALAQTLPFNLHLKQMFSQGYYPAVGPTRCRKGIFKSRLELEGGRKMDKNSSMNDDGNEKKDAEISIVNRINRHSKRLMESILETAKKSAPGKPKEKSKENHKLSESLLHLNSSPIRQYYSIIGIRRPAPDEKGVTKENMQQLMDGIQSLRVKSIKDYIIKAEEAKIAYIKIEANGSAAECAQRDPTSQSSTSLRRSPNPRTTDHYLERLHQICKESHLLLRLFYKQFPITNPKKKANIERIVMQISELKKNVPVSLVLIAARLKWRETRCTSRPCSTYWLH